MTAPYQYPMSGGVPGRERPVPERPGVAKPRLVVAAAVAGLAAALGVAAMFFDYYTYVSTDDGETTFKRVMGLWSESYLLSDSQDSSQGIVPLFGIVITLVVLALVITAVFAVLGAPAAASRARGRVARIAAVVHCTAAVTSVMMFVLWLVSLFSYDAPPAPGREYSYVHYLAPGFWLLIAMAVLAVAAAVLTWIPDPRPAAPTGIPPTGGQAPSPQQYAQQYAQPGYPQQPYPQQPGYPQQYTQPGYPAQQQYGWQPPTG